MVKPSKRLLTISAVIAAGLLAIIYLSVADIHANESANIQAKIENSTSRVESRFNSIVENTSYVMKTLNKQIAKDPYNYEYINKTMSNFWGSEGADNSMAWTIFSWSDANFKLVVDAVYGILQEPVQIPLKRENMIRSKQHPNVLQLGKPVIGATSHKWLIPLSMGIYDSEGKYAGALIPGLNLTVLADKLKTEVKDKNITFYIVGKNDELLIDSSKKNQSQGNKLPKPMHGALQHKVTEEFHLNAFSGNNYYTSPFSSYDYRIVAVYNPKVIAQAFYEELITRFLMLFILVIAVAFCVRYFYEWDRKKQTKRFAELSQHTTKTDFLKVSGVELKNITNRIIKNSEELKENAPHLPGHYATNAENIFEDTTDLERFVDDLMQFTNEGELSFKPEREFTDIKEVFERVHYLNASYANTRHVKLKLMLQNKLPKLWADPRRLRQILNNLIYNAVTYSTTGSQVIITAQAEEKIMKIIVEDHGAGMNAEQLKNFHAKLGGDSGIVSGRLHLVRKLVEAHDAKIDIESAPGIGTKIVLTFALYENIIVEEDDKKIIQFKPRKKAKG